MTDARSFLEAGIEEIRSGRSKGNLTREKEGYEKVFHGLEEACVARIQKYGIDPGTNHDEIRYWLETISDRELVETYDLAFAVLHTLGYYRGWTVRERIDPVIERAKKAIDKIEKKIRGP